MLYALSACSRTDVVDIRRAPENGDDDVPPVIASGDDVGPANTGFSGYIDPDLDRPLTESDLVPCTNSMLTTPGAVVERCRFTDTAVIGADDITLRGCLVDMGGGGQDTLSIDIPDGRSNVRVEYCTVRVNAGSSGWVGINVRSATDSVIEHNDISGMQQGMVDNGTDSIVRYNFMHDFAWDDSPGGSGNCISVYDGDNHTIVANRLVYPPRVNFCIDLSPFSSGAQVDGVTVENNFIDGGNYHLGMGSSVANAGPYNVRVLNNRFGGHTNPAFARYATFNNSQGQPVVETAAELSANPEAVLWPTTGQDVNTWSECSDLIPDRTGQVVAAD